MNVLPVSDMSNTFPEHSMVTGFLATACSISGERMTTGSWFLTFRLSAISGDRKNESFTGIPRFVMEVLSDETEEYDRNEKMDILRRVGVPEYRITDWRKKQVEIWLSDGREDGSVCPYLCKTVTEADREELRPVMFPGFKITYEEQSDPGQ